MTDAVARLQDLREKVWNKEEIPPEDYVKVLEDLRQHRRAGAKVAKSSGGSKSVQLSKEESDKLLGSFGSSE